MGMLYITGLSTALLCVYNKMKTFLHKFP